LWVEEEFEGLEVNQIHPQIPKESFLSHKLEGNRLRPLYWIFEGGMGWQNITVFVPQLLQQFSASQTEKRYRSNVTPYKTVTRDHRLTATVDAIKAIWPEELPTEGMAQARDDKINKYFSENGKARVSGSTRSNRKIVP
jgi:hypothetical protein